MKRTRQKRTYRPTEFLESRYRALRPALAFNAKSAADWRRWSLRLRRTLKELLGGLDDPVVPLRAEVLQRRKMRGYVREKVVYQSRRDTTVPAWVLIPEGAEPPLPGMICLHGHGRGKDEIVAIGADGKPRQELQEYQADFAIQAVRRGYLAIVPDQFGFGERREPEHIKENPGRSSCRVISMAGMLMGRTTVGMRVWDVMRTVDYLLTRPEVVPSRIGCMGISGGGTTTLFAAALERRISAALVSGYLNTFHDSIFSITHCEDNYVPSILRYTEMPDLACLIAPRVLFVEGGTKDGIFPVKATRYAIRQVKRVYDLLKMPERFGWQIFEGEHQFCGEKGFPFLDRWLRPRG